jgi:hypothetical protein
MDPQIKMNMVDQWLADPKNKEKNPSDYELIRQYRQDFDKNKMLVDPRTRYQFKTPLTAEILAGQNKLRKPLPQEMMPTPVTPLSKGKAFRHGLTGGGALAAGGLSALLIKRLLEDK